LNAFVEQCRTALKDRAEGNDQGHVPVPAHVWIAPLSASTSKSPPFHSPDGRLDEARFRIS
jgi:hypothetical protein